MPYVVAALIGALVGAGELIARYRDAPARALRNTPASLYIGLNALAAVTALGMIETFGWTFGVDDEGHRLEWTRVLIAGFGAMALLRSAVFVVRSGDQDVGIGPSGFLQVVLSAADRAVDRRRAGARADEVARWTESRSGRLRRHCRRTVWRSCRTRPRRRRSRSQIRSGYFATRRWKTVQRASRSASP